MLFVVCALLANVPNALFLLLLKALLRSTLFSRVSTFIPLLLVPVSRNFARISSVVLLNLSRRSSVTQRLTRLMSVKLSWSVVQPVSPALSNLFPTSSTAKSPTRASTPMRPLLTVQLFRLLSFPAIRLRRLKTFFSLMLPLFPSVSRRLVVS